MTSRIITKPQNVTATSFVPVFGKKGKGQVPGQSSFKHNEIDTILTLQAVHNFGNVNVNNVQSFNQSCPLLLSTPSRCPFGGACHTCPPRIQTKLKIGQPNDKYEQEADRIADEIMRMPDPCLQRKECSTCNENDEEKLIQTKPLAGQVTPLVQRQPIEEKKEEEVIQTKTAEGLTHKVTPAISSGIQLLKGGGRPLTMLERSFFEPRIGADFSNVRIHNDTRAASVARSVNARAFTFGHNLVFGSGQFTPYTPDGKRLVAHELTHFMQQTAGPRNKNTRVTPTSCHILQAKGKPFRYSLEGLWAESQRRRDEEFFECMAKNDNEKACIDHTTSIFKMDQEKPPRQYMPPPQHSVVPSGRKTRTKGTSGLGDPIWIRAAELQNIPKDLRGGIIIIEVPRNKVEFWWQKPIRPGAETEEEMEASHQGPAQRGPVSPQPSSGQKTAEEPNVEGWKSFAQGFLLGSELSENVTWSALAGDVIGGIVPYHGQGKDILDIYLGIQKVRRGEEGGVIFLGAATLGVIPGLDFLKGGLKGGRKLLGEAAQSTAKRRLSKATVEALSKIKRPTSQLFQGTAGNIDNHILDLAFQARKQLLQEAGSKAWGYNVVVAKVVVKGKESHVVLRNIMHGDHSEYRLLEFMQKKGGKVLQIFSERIPCHKGRKNCSDLIKLAFPDADVIYGAINKVDGSWTKALKIVYGIIN